jgi:hypothetical protein
VTRPGPTFFSSSPRGAGARAPAPAEGSRWGTQPCSWCGSRACRHRRVGLLVPRRVGRSTNLRSRSAVLVFVPSRVDRLTENDADWTSGNTDPGGVIPVEPSRGRHGRYQVLCGIGWWHSGGFRVTSRPIADRAPGVGAIRPDVSLSPSAGVAEAGERQGFLADGTSCSFRRQIDAELECFSCQNKSLGHWADCVGNVQPNSQPNSQPIFESTRRSRPGPHQHLKPPRLASDHHGSPRYLQPTEAT